MDNKSSNSMSGFTLDLCSILIRFSQGETKWDGIGTVIITCGVIRQSKPLLPTSRTFHNPYSNAALTQKQCCEDQKAPLALLKLLVPALGMCSGFFFFFKFYLFFFYFGRDWKASKVKFKRPLVWIMRSVFLFVTARKCRQTQKQPNERLQSWSWSKSLRLPFFLSYNCTTNGVLWLSRKKKCVWRDAILLQIPHLLSSRSKKKAVQHAAVWPAVYNSVWWRFSSAPPPLENTIVKCIN